jgi:hypothetical protein
VPTPSNVIAARSTFTWAVSSRLYMPSPPGGMVGLVLPAPANTKKRSTAISFDIQLHPPRARRMRLRRGDADVPVRIRLKQNVKRTFRLSILTCGPSDILGKYADDLWYLRLGLPKILTLSYIRQYTVVEDTLGTITLLTNGLKLTFCDP